MSVKELNQSQREELKCNYLSQLMDEYGDTPSYAMLANVDEYISDLEIDEAYAGTFFTEDDFFAAA